MPAKILYITDFHKRWKDSESVKGSISNQRTIQEEIIHINHDLGITHNIIGGDWYDRGFHGLGPAYSEIEMDRRLSKSVNGNVYLCVGNHFYLERDENPEMYIIQPNNLLRPQFDMAMPEEPIFRVVPQLIIGDVQIDFFHFDKIQKMYVQPLSNPNIKFHIGIYHDDNVVPGWVREKEGYGGTVTQTYLNKVFENIDMALCGHIHSKIGWTSILTEAGKKVPMCIPGVLRATKNAEHEKHYNVELPVLTINDDSSVDVSSVTISTHLDMLRFSETKKLSKKSTAAQPRTMTTQQLLSSKNTKNLLSVGAYMTNKGYTPIGLKIVDAAMNSELSFTKVLAIIQNYQEV